MPRGIYKRTPEMKTGKCNLGRKHTQATKEKISIGMMGVQNRLGDKHPKDCKHCKNLKDREPWNKGMSIDSIRGEKNGNWKGGTTSKNKLIRSSIEYKLWRKKVFERDNFTCLFCGTTGVKIHADHIKPFAYFLDLRFEINNGRTLCVPCHKLTDTYLSNSQKIYAQ